MPVWARLELLQLYPKYRLEVLVVFDASRSGSTILLGVGNCLASFVGSSSELFNSGDTILMEVGNCLASFVGGSSKSFDLGDTVLICT